jgi:threonine dehydrogenase-like Zn-dependent dehydrogenase
MPDRLARAFWIVEAGRGEIREEVLPAPGPGQLVVSARRSGISRGTESLVFKGLVPPSQWQTMRCPFQIGEFSGPLKYGYASVGQIDAGPDALLGRRVFCLYPHQSAYVVPIGAVTLLPDDVPDTRAVLSANMETAVNGLWDAAPRLGDRISVVGAGVVGALVAALAARIPGVEVELVDPDPGRAGLAAALGCAFSLPDKADDERDIVVHASGQPAGLETALGLAGFEATVLEMSWYGAQRVPAPLGEAFHSRRLTLRSSQVGSVATAQRARWDYQRRMALAVSLLADPVFDKLLTGQSTLDELPATLSRLSDRPDGTLCHSVIYL